MTPEQIDHVFGRGRLKMDTGAHVEVFREAAPPGEIRRYTKRFLTTADGDYVQWTEREWRILALLIGHGSRCVPDIVQYDRDARGTKLVQTYDAGATVDQWATLLPVERNGTLYARVFEDCAHWWGLAHHCLVALDEIHSLQLVHLDIKGDNICIPIGPDGYDPAAPDERLFPMFGKLRLIDFAFSLVSGESLPTPLPIGWQPDYDYQSPRLLHALEAGRAGDLEPTENLDWRCDMYSLAAMLKRYLPGERRLCPPELSGGWTVQRYDAAKALILKIRAAHDRELTLRRPHAELIAETSAHVRENELAQSLDQGWTLARDAQPFAVPATPLTPVTRLAMPLRLVIPPRDDIVAILDAVRAEDRAPLRSAKRGNRVPLIAAAAGVAAIGILLFVTDSGAFVADAARFVLDAGRAVRAAMTPAMDSERPSVATTSSLPGADGKLPASPAALPVPDAAVTPEAAAATADAAMAAEAATPTAAVPHDASVAVTESSEASPSPDALPLRSGSAEHPDSTPALPAPASLPDAAASASTRAEISPVTPPSPPPATSGLRSRQRDGNHSKPVSPPSRWAKAPSPATAARALSLPPAKTAPRTQLAAGNKPLHSTNTTRAVEAHPPPTVAAKRGTDAFVASRVPAGAAPIVVASAASRAPLPGPAAERPSDAAISTDAAKISAILANQDIATVPTVPEKAATTKAASNAMPTPPVPAVAPPQAPTVVETPRTSPAVTNALPNSSRSAPIVQPSPPVAIVPPAPPNAAPIIDSPPPLAMPSVPLARPNADQTAAPTRPGAPAIVEIPRLPAPRLIAEAPRSRPSPGEIRDANAYRAQASWILENIVPRTSAQSQAQVSRVLLIAASAYRPDQDRGVIAAAATPGVANDVAFMPRHFAPLDARRWHEEARRAFWWRRDVPEALDLALVAFGANPYDPEIAGFLAYLYMKVLPAQPDRARQLALHAIGMRNSQYQTGRSEDWMTFAIASALTGRETDARYGFYALVALTRNPDLACHTALGALASYGERLREPVDALLYRLQQQGRSDDSPIAHGRRAACNAIRADDVMPPR